MCVSDGVGDMMIFCQAEDGEVMSKSSPDASEGYLGVVAVWIL